MTEKGKHTPGPWEISESTLPDGGYQIEGNDCVIVSRAPWPNRLAESRANARLIVAAPQLLDALKWLARGEHEWSVPQEALAFMERAIAKAEPSIETA